MNTYVRPRALGFAAGLLAGAGVLTMHGTALAQKTIPPIRIDANREGWTDTGVTLAQGEQLQLGPSGSAGWEPGIDYPSSGAGASTCALTIPDAPVGGLLARVGTTAPVVVREGTTLNGPGPVTMMYNDCPGKYFDNVGGFIVSATLVAAASAPPATAAAAEARATAVAAPVSAPAPAPALEAGEAKGSDGWGIWPLVAALALAAGGYVAFKNKKQIRIAIPSLMPRRIGVRFPDSARLESSAWLAPVRLRLIQEEHRHTELSIGGPDQDIDFGLNSAVATLAPREDGTVRLNVIPSGGRVLVDGVAVILGQRLNDGARVHMGTREFVYRVDAEEVAAYRGAAHDVLGKIDPRAAAIAEATDRRSA